MVNGVGFRDRHYQGMSLLVIPTVLCGSVRDGRSSFRIQGTSRFREP